MALPWHRSERAFMLEQIRTLVAHIACTPINDVDANLDDCGVQSIDMLRIVGSIETTMDVEFDESHLTRENFTTVRMICELIARIRSEDMHGSRADA
jgi:acyl carrier protein